MPNTNQKKIIRLLGVGFDTEDGHVRITKSENFEVLMGSAESHEYITQLITKIETELKASGLNLDDLTPEEFSRFVQAIK